MRGYFILFAACVSALFANASEIDFDALKAKGANEIFEMKNHLVALSYPSNEYVQINIFDKSSKKHIQTFDNVEGKCKYEECFEKGDYNFDGIEDFSLANANRAFGNGYGRYFLYNPKDKKFFLSDISGSNLKFDHKNKIVYETNRRYAGSSFRSATYKIANNKMVKLEERCYKYDRWKSGEYVEYDCDTYTPITIYLESTRLEKNFELQIRITDENFTKGEAQYKGQKESIELKLKEKKEYSIVFEEIYKGAVNGTYALDLYDNEIVDGSYTRKDGKKFDLKAVEVLEIENYIVALSYPSMGNPLVDVFDKSTGKRIQTLKELGDSESMCYYGKCFEKGDYNFDGFEEFSLTYAYGTLSNSLSHYFLYDPKGKKFFLSDISGVSLWFDQENKIVHETNSCCAGYSLEKTIYKIVDNKLVWIEEHCYKYELRNDDSWGDEYAEHDCETSVSETYYLESVGLEKNFELRIRILSGNPPKGEAQYRGQKESMQLNIRENGKDKIVFEEIYKGTVNGTYTLNLSDGNAVDGVYTRKDGKKFELKAAKLD
ncbi:MAG: hypothetical protein LBO72_03680 [Helicobacteraceae bacterium]|jgi:molybdopterin-binding protein|nr:hypothetical protein [Helicobacteraceae bacterium]